MFRDKHEHTRIVSSTPGRTRVKVSLKRRSKEEMGLLATALKDRLHPVDARINIQSGSILVHHPENTLEDVCAVLKDLGVMLVTVVCSSLCCLRQLRQIALFARGAASSAILRPGCRRRPLMV